MIQLSIANALPGIAAPRGAAAPTTETSGFAVALATLMTPGLTPGVPGAPGETLPEAAEALLPGGQAVAAGGKKLPVPDLEEKAEGEATDADSDADKDSDPDCADAAFAWFAAPIVVDAERTGISAKAVKGETRPVVLGASPVPPKGAPVIDAPTLTPVDSVLPATEAVPVVATAPAAIAPQAGMPKTVSGSPSRDTPPAGVAPHDTSLAGIAPTLAPVVPEAGAATPPAAPATPPANRQPPLDANGKPVPPTLTPAPAQPAPGTSASELSALAAATGVSSIAIAAPTETRPAAPVALAHLRPRQGAPAPTLTAPQVQPVALPQVEAVLNAPVLTGRPATTAVVGGLSLDTGGTPRRFVRDPIGATFPVAPDAPQAPAVAAPAQMQNAVLDTSRQEWVGKMIDQIETLRDAMPIRETRIRLSPEMLGPVDISIKHEGDRIHVHFAAETQAARQMLTDAQPRLADIAESRGVKLGQTTVDSGNAGAGSGQRQDAAPGQSRPSRPTSTTTKFKEDSAKSDERVA